MGGAWERHGIETFFQPMTSAFSRKSRRVIIKPYFLMRPWWEPEHLRTEHRHHHLRAPPPLTAVPRPVFNRAVHTRHSRSTRGESPLTESSIKD